MSDQPEYDLATLAVRFAQARSNFAEHSEAIYTSSSFTFDSAASAAAAFAGDSDVYVYSRFSNPGVQSFEQRLAKLEGAQSCIATSSGMAAILGLVLANLSAGDHIIASANLFGATRVLFSDLLPRFGITTSFVSDFEGQHWLNKLEASTKLVFFETPTNPTMRLTDIAAVSRACKAERSDVLIAVDNCFCTPISQRPLALGADIVVHSATKLIDGQGRCVGGAVAGDRSVVGEAMGKLMRTAGLCLSPFNAWVFNKGLETLSVRVEQSAANAAHIANALEQSKQVERVYYPGLDSHPQRHLIGSQQKNGGAVVSFEVVGGQQAAWKIIDATRLCSITANLGDTRTTITHPATTTHARWTEDERLAVGIRPNLIRLAVGLESPDDILNDLKL